jgi:hypothetical protein
MFFIRLRRHAKPIFVGLALAFALMFLFAGVGSGTGAGDIIQTLLGMRGGNATKSAENDAKAHPHSLNAWVNLASIYERDGRHTDAVKAYEKALKVSPEDTGVLTNLSDIWHSITIRRYDRYATLQAELAAAEGPLGTDPFQTVLGVGNDPLLSSYTNTLTEKLVNAESSLTNAAKSWENAYQRYYNAIPKTNAAGRAQDESNLGDAASAATDYPTAIKAYKAAIKDYRAVLRSNPKDTYVKGNIAALRKELAALQKAVGGR